MQGADPGRRQEPRDLPLALGADRGARELRARQRDGAAHGRPQRRGDHPVCHQGPDGHRTPRTRTRPPAPEARAPQSLAENPRRAALRGSRAPADRLSAQAGKDYVAQSGTLTFAHGVVSQSLTIEIIDDDKYENDETFTVILSEPTGGATFDKNTDGGAATEVCTVVILNDDEITTKAEMVAQILRLNTDNIALAGEDWVEQLRGAIIPEGGATAKEKFMHFLNVPWKLMFAIVPPPGMCGGFPCFVGSLIMIGVQVPSAAPDPPAAASARRYFRCLPPPRCRWCSSPTSLR